MSEHSGPGRPPGAWPASVQRQEHIHGLELRVHLPGIQPASLRVRAESQVVTIRGTSAGAPGADQPDAGQPRVASIPLSKPVEAAGMVTMLQGDVLTIHLPWLDARLAPDVASGSASGGDHEDAEETDIADAAGELPGDDPTPGWGSVDDER